MTSLSSVVAATMLIKRSVENRARYGPSAPVAAERIWVDPLAVGVVLRHGVLGRAKTGSVRHGDWDLQTEGLADHPKTIVCQKHWGEGMSWEDAGGFCLPQSRRSAQELRHRYEALDEMFQKVKTDRTLLSTTEMGHKAWFYRDELYMHVGRGPQLIFGHKGYHRLAAARVLGIRCVPAVLGVVHERVVTDWSMAVCARSRMRPEQCI